ncbi:glutathione S-transferase [Phanerochaete sordida]|uniref:glutathione transferase n=1 Tax=Phanerochaete sordida TaxID=48140 RepID=A0A9P3G8T3_9APHY|nr:glutathione S-transferase [Phanerochaete sordida]
MVLKLYGNPISPCTKRVATVLHEKRVPFELITIDFTKGEHKRPAFVAAQPFGQVPYLDDDGFIVYESRAIARYVAAKYASQGTPLLPPPGDVRATARFEQAASVETSNFDAFASGLAYQKVFIPMRGGATNEAHVQYLAQTLATRLAGYEAILTKQKYLAGDVSQAALATLACLLNVRRRSPSRTCSTCRTVHSSRPSTTTTSRTLRSGRTSPGGGRTSPLVLPGRLCRRRLSLLSDFHVNEQNVTKMLLGLRTRA